VLRLAELGAFWHASCWAKRCPGSLNAGPRFVPDRGGAGHRFRGWSSGRGGGSRTLGRGGGRVHMRRSVCTGALPPGERTDNGTEAGTLLIAAVDTRRLSAVGAGPK